MSKYTIAFYNLENLFDTINDPNTLDDDFTPESEKKWTSKRLEKKIYKLGQVISLIGQEDNKNAPVIVGVAEVENKTVLQELINGKALKDKGYAFVHFNSPDERGIDTALLYRKSFFKLISAKPHELHLLTPEGKRDFTRDVLHVKGILGKQEIHILVNHWPSRRAGVDVTAYRRLEAAKKNRHILAEILEKEPDARIIVMGDFNDDPNSDSVLHMTGTEFYNPMRLLLTKYQGSLNYKGAWNLFDQIIVSNNLMKSYNNPISFEKAGIFNGKLVEEHTGRYKGNPFRTYVGKKYLGGVSDHFPVYSIFNVED